MPHDNNRTLAIRALNAVRLIHPPTYLATRVLFDSVAGDKDSAWGDCVVPYKYALRDKGRFHIAPAFKGIREDGSHDFRDFHIPSPTTLLAEAAALTKLAALPEFQKPENVFSYLWPATPSSPSNYSYYTHGFRSRQNKISELVQSVDDSTVVVLDIKDFYPSIDRNVAMQQFMDRLNRSDPSSISRSSAGRLVEHLCSELSGDKGIVTGSELSHVLGDCAFTELDNEFASKYGDKYLRYVDDLVFVVPRRNKDSVVEYVEHALGSKGYKLNARKSHSMDAREWLEHVPPLYEKVRPNSFEALLFQIKVYLSKNPDGHVLLSDELQKLDFRLPIDRLVSDANSNSFRQQLLTYAKRKWRVFWSAYRADLDHVLKLALTARMGIQDELERLLNQPVHNAGLRRKWQVQQLRYNVNRAVYMLPVHEIQQLSRDLDVGKLTEFIQFKSMVSAVFGDDISAIAQMPGAAANTTGSLLRQLGRRVKWPDGQDMTPERIQVLLSLMAYDVVELPDSLQSHPELSYFQPSNEIAGGHALAFEFRDEVQCLMLQNTRSHVSSYFERRFAPDEGAALEALTLNDRGSS